MRCSSEFARPSEKAAVMVCEVLGGTERQFIKMGRASASMGPGPQYRSPVADLPVDEAAWSFRKEG